MEHIKPNEKLSKYIDRYWFFSAQERETAFMPKLTPGVGIDLFIHYNEPFSTLEYGKMPQAHIIFSGKNSCQILPSFTSQFVGIRFRAGALRKFTNIPLVHLLDSNASVEDIWGIQGKNFTKLISSIKEKEMAVIEIEHFLEQQFRKNAKAPLVWDEAINYLYKNFDDITIDQLSSKLNISNRHLRRKFTEETGFSPKHFQSLARFHQVIKFLLLNKDKKYLSIALENGYFDQMHFIKNFKQLMSCVPSDYLHQQHFLSHFYYPSIKD